MPSYVPIVPTDDWLLIAPIDDCGMDELRRSSRYRIALWFTRLCCVWLLLLFVAMYVYNALAVSTQVFVLTLVLVGCTIVLRVRAGVPTIRPSKWDAPARHRWRQFDRDVFWLPRR